MAPSKKKSKKQKKTFSLDADKAANVVLAGDFNNWSQTSHPMEKNKNGVWEISVQIDPGRHEYKFLVDGHWQGDPQNEKVCRNCFGTDNNILMVTQS